MKWTVGWYPLHKEWNLGKPKDKNCDVDFEICLGSLQIFHWK